ncbi:MAG: glutamate-1-semialdehyde-2,1-aminomutase [Flavobacteriaceae bacterium]|nr:glutamate-1-semialdehyde-2,1-aminomutase [Flavobacteriaceae bacterium]
MMYKKSIKAFQESSKVIPGGVNSPVRAFKSVGCDPVFFERGKGSKLYDIDGNKYIDCVSSWGPLIFGHSDKETVSAINFCSEKGTTYGAPTLIETEIAEKIVQMVPSIESVRMVNSGTEATMSAIRLARGYTKKELIIKFAGNYHGHGDSFLIKAGSGALTLGLPDSPGVTKNTARDTLIATYNDKNSVEKVLKENIDNVAAIIVEPIAGNMGLVTPDNRFLKGLRELSLEYECLLIFDEVMTGFRVAQGGAQELYNVKPDITTLGKVIGGGLPVGAYGGSKKIMDYLAPQGPVYQAGTLSGNPLAMNAGLSVLKRLNHETFDILEKVSLKIHKGFLRNIEETNTKAIINRVGSMMTLFFTDSDNVCNFEDALSCDTDKYSNYFKSMLDMGVYLPPSQYECCFFSTSLTNDDIDKIIHSNKIALNNLK